MVIALTQILVRVGETSREDNFNTKFHLQNFILPSNYIVNRNNIFLSRQVYYWCTISEIPHFIKYESKQINRKLMKYLYRMMMPFHTNYHVN